MAKAKTAKKVTFTWEGTNREGKKVKGETNAINMNFIKADLRRQGIIPKKVRKKAKPLFSGGDKPITTADIAVFARQLATMIKSGVPLVQSLDITSSGHANPNMSNLISEVKAEVEAGGTFANGLRSHPEHFDALFCNLVEAGEQSGALETLLDKVALYKEKSEAIRLKIKKALVYPISVLIVAFVVTAILLIFVVPIFADMFESFGADLPAFTQFVVGLSNSFVDNWYYIFGGIIAASMALSNAFKRSVAFREAVDRAALKAPAVSDLVMKTAIARFSRTLATMFAAGVPLVEAMQSVAYAAGNTVYTKALLSIRDDIASGQQLQAGLKQYPELFPNMVVQMVSIGEESGALDEMLAKVADYYEEQVDTSVDMLTSLLEPLIMAFLAVVVGGLVISMYLPIFKMGSVV